MAKREKQILSENIFLSADEKKRAENFTSLWVQYFLQENKEQEEKPSL